MRKDQGTVVDARFTGFADVSGTKAKEIAIKLITGAG